MFNELAAREFAFLETSFGFSAPQAQGGGHWHSLTYQNATTRVEVYYEIGTLPLVTVSRLERKGQNVVAPEGVSLRLIIEESGGHLRTWTADDVPDNILESEIHFLAEALATLGRPYLLGDFTSAWTVMVKKQQDIYRRRAEADHET